MLLLPSSTVSQVRQADARLQIAEVIGWLPTTIETMIVATLPFDPGHRPMGPNDVSAFGWFAVGPIASREHEELFRALTGSHIRFVVEGSRAFRRPGGGLGLGRYEGVHALVFEEGDGAAIDRFMTRLATSGGLATSVSGFDAARLNWRSENADWSSFVARPRSDVLLVATAENILAETLDRIRRGGSGRALPEDLPEWSGVDKTAPLWAIRHYSRDDEGLDPTSPLTTSRRAANEPDTLAVGLAVTIAGDTSPHLAVHYYSGSPQALSIAQRFWEHPAEGLNPLFEVGPNRSVRISAAPTRPEAWTMLWLVLLAALGHAIYL
jgi:hypothetical protein